MRYPALGLFALLSGCGYVGDPLPPALHIPEKVDEIQAEQIGDRLLVRFASPKLTTESIAIRDLREIELRVGPFTPPLDVNAWAPTANRVPVAVRDSVSVDIPVTHLAGQRVAVSMRALGSKDRWSAWSEPVILNILTPLPAPSNLSASAVAQGVRLSWQTTPRPSTVFRISRTSLEDGDFETVGETPDSSFVDQSAVFGTSYRYRIQVVAKQDGHETLSPFSGVVAITPQDTFPPAIPKGLNALAGIQTIELVWEANTEADFRGYHIYRALAQGAFERVAAAIEAPAFSDKTVEAGKVYRYTVSAVDQNGNESAQTEPVTSASP